MAYNPNIPQASDVPATSQGQLLANFQALQTYLNLNHDNIVGGTGKHKFVTLPIQATDPVTAVGEMALFTKTFLGMPNLFLAPENGATPVSMLPIYGTVGNMSYLALPGGVKMRWGHDITDAGSGHVDISLNAAGVHASALFTVAPHTTATRQKTIGATTDHVAADYAVFVTSCTAATLRVHGFLTSSVNKSTDVQFNYFAIGI